MRLTSDSFGQGDPIPSHHALCVPDPETHVTFAGNRNPHVRWEDVPEGTRSFALIMHDPDVPSVGDDVNQEGRSVPRDLPRVDFFHWLLADIPGDLREIAEGAVSDGVTPRGKPTGRGEYGRAGRNDYTGWFAGDPDMDGVYGNYDGPAPPWNDERLHHYHITVFALDTDRLDLPDSYTGSDLRAAMEGHVLAQASWLGTYTLNPDLRDG